MLEVSPEGRRVLRRRCPVCAAQPGSGAVLEAGIGEHVLRRVLAYENYAGAPAETVDDAVALLGGAGSAPDYLRGLAARPVALGRVPARMSFALEIALAEERERDLLALEVAELERRWRKEEELAAIVDGELTPMAAPGASPAPVHGGAGAVSDRA